MLAVVNLCFSYSAIINLIGDQISKSFRYFCESVTARQTGSAVVSKNYFGHVQQQILSFVHKQC